jgi:hypothetical protein
MENENIIKELAEENAKLKEELQSTYIIVYFIID